MIPNSGGVCPFVRRGRAARLMTLIPNILKEGTIFGIEAFNWKMTMASSRSQSSVGEPKPVTLRIFYLIDELKSTADHLCKLFTRQPPPTRDTRLQLYRKQKRGKKISPDITVLPFNALTDLMDPVVNSENESSDDSRLHSDVVVILGHSNVFTFGSLGIADILAALLHPKPPSFVVFLGCCGGNGRYGPLAMLSQLPEWQNTVFSFFQRRIYVHELCHTSAVLAVQYYMHLKLRCDDLTAIKRNINRAFSDAKNDYRFKYKYDTALLLNCKEEQTAQTILNMVKNPVLGITISTEDIPLSCWQLAMYHAFTVEKIEKKLAIKKFIYDTKKELNSLATKHIIRNNEVFIAMIDKKFKYELEQKKLYDIIDLACEIQLLEVHKQTIELLRINKWHSVDHLQFFVAMLHGYWGENDYDDLRECATYHIKEMMKHPRACDLHTYQLCCVGYCLFSPETYILFHEKSFFLWTCAKGHPTLITDKGYETARNGAQLPRFPCLNALPTPEDELSWSDAFDLCTKLKGEDNKFVIMYNNDHYNMHSFRKDECRCKGNGSCTYEYGYQDLTSALNAVKDCLFPDPKDNDRCIKHYYKYYYGIRKFENKDDRDLGYMKCFNFQYEAVVPIKYLEMRVIHDYKTLKKLYDSKKSDLMKSHEKVWFQVSRCRFVFAYVYNRRKEEILGKLYFTDSHYGQDKICKEQIGKKLGISSEDLNKKNYFEMSKNLKKSDMYSLQDECLRTEIVRRLIERLTNKFQRENLYELLLGNNSKTLDKVYDTVNELICSADLQKELIKMSAQKLLSGNYMEKKFAEKLKEVEKLLIPSWKENVSEMLQNSIESLKLKLKEDSFYPFIEIGNLTVTPEHILLEKCEN